MKHSEALRPLSREHHQALFVCKTIKDSDSSELAAEAFIDFWTREGARHFRIEEEVLLPGSGLPGPSSDEGVARLLDDHLEIRRRAGRVIAGDASLAEIKELGSLLHNHVRFEERELFPRIESRIDPAALDRLREDIEVAGQGRPDQLFAQAEGSLDAKSRREVQP